MSLSPPKFRDTIKGGELYIPYDLKGVGRRSTLLAGKPPCQRTSVHVARIGMGMKIGCIVYVQLPAMLRPCYQLSWRYLQKKSDNDDAKDSLLVLFMN